MAVALFTATTGGFAVWAHWPSTPTHAKAKANVNMNASPAARDAGSTPRSTQPPAAPDASGSDVQVADCPDDCDPSSCCPISMAANAFSRMLDHFHPSSTTSH